MPWKWSESDDEERKKWAERERRITEAEEDLRSRIDQKFLDLLTDCYRWGVSSDCCEVEDFVSWVFGLVGRRFEEPVLERSE